MSSSVIRDRVPKIFSYQGDTIGCSLTHNCIMNQFFYLAFWQQYLLTFIHELDYL